MVEDYKDYIREKLLRKQLISSSILTYEEWKSRKLDEDIEDSEIE